MTEHRPREPVEPVEAGPPAPMAPGDPSAYPPMPPGDSVSAPGAPGAATAGVPEGPGPAFDRRGRVRRGKVSAVWVGLIAAAILVILLIIFIAQNLTSVPIHFLGASGHIPVGLALVIAAVAGILVAAIPGTVRILQLRRAVRQTRAHLSPNRPH